MLSIVYAVCHKSVLNAECCYAECHYAECPEAHGVAYNAEVSIDATKSFILNATGVNTINNSTIVDVGVTHQADAIDIKQTEAVFTTHYLCNLQMGPVS